MFHVGWIRQHSADVDKFFSDKSPQTAKQVLHTTGCHEFHLWILKNFLWISKNNGCFVSIYFLATYLRNKIIDFWGKTAQIEN